MRRASFLFGLVLLFSLVAVNGFAQSAAVDTDGDGLSDDYETAHGLNPNVADSDGDGVVDGLETDPGTGQTFEAGDGDGVGDFVPPVTNPVPQVGDGSCSINTGQHNRPDWSLLALFALPLGLFLRRRRQSF